MPKVSVVIPTFNCRHLILEAIYSVLDQSFKDIEIIVIDDGSTDNTDSLLKPLVENKQIFYFYQSNKGLSNARNEGIRRSRGEFIKFLDADDILYSEQIERQVNHLSGKTMSVISITDYEMEYPSKNKRIFKINFGSIPQLAGMIQANFGPVHASLVSRELIKKIGSFDENLQANEDTDFWLRALINGAYFESVNYVGCRYRILTTSLSSNSEKQFYEYCKVFENLNRMLFQLIDKVSIEVLIQLVQSNTRLIHMCFARRVKPTLIIPTVIMTSSFVCKIKMKSKINLLTRIFGFLNVVLIKYLVCLLRDRKYTDLLLNNIKWRTEENGNKVK